MPQNTTWAFLSWVNAPRKGSAFKVVFVKFKPITVFILLACAKAGKLFGCSGVPKGHASLCLET